MKTYIAIAIAVLFGGGQLFAQGDANVFDLQKCINYGLENHESIKKSILDAEQAESKIKETISIGLPQVNGKIDFMANVNIQSQFLPANIFDPTAPADLIVPVAFGMKYSNNLNATLTQLIFDGSYFVGLQASRKYKDLMSRSISNTKVGLVKNITEAYYRVLVSQEQQKSLTQNLSTLDSLYRDTKILLENGFVEKLDLNRIEVNRNNLKVEIQKVENMIAVANDMLKFQMGMPLSENLIVQDKLETYKQTIDGYASSLGDSVSADYNNRIEYQLLQIQKEMYELNYKNEKVKALPNAAAFASFGANTGQNDLGPIFNPDNYRDYFMVGMTINVPIFSSFRRKHRMAQNQVDIDKTQLDMEVLQRGIDFEVKQSWASLKNALSTLKNLERNVELADEVYTSTKIKYKAGVGSNLEVVEAESSLKQAKTQYNTAIYDALVAKLNLETALGNLYNE